MTRRLPFRQMSPEEVREWVQVTRAALLRKMQREQAYLTRRAARNVHTPTDEVYEADAVLETDLLALLNEIEEAIGEVLH